jgi:serine/threonine protein phosphatase PrpC
MGDRLRAESASATHVGKVRQVNEDSLLDRPDLGLWAVADGMGGHGGGDVASQMSVAALNTLPTPESAISMRRDFEQRVAEVHERLLAVAAERGDSVVGTTLVALLVYDVHYACLWCGDSRAYLWRGGRLQQITRDHSQAQELIDRGVLTREQAKTWPGRNVVTRALGANGAAFLDMVDGPSLAGDRILLCSDGLVGHVSDAEIAERLGRLPVRAVCDSLIALTLSRGAADNISLVVIEFVAT